jgi:hypothetical protein
MGAHVDKALMPTWNARLVANAPTAKNTFLSDGFYKSFSCLMPAGFAVLTANVTGGAATAAIFQVS